MTHWKLEGHEDSILPDGFDFSLSWHDEFDGTELDTSKWHYRTHMMGQRHRAWRDHGVTLDGNSNAVFTIFEENGEICSAQLETGYNYMDERNQQEDCWGGSLVWPIAKFREHEYVHQYGYYECRCRLQQKPGWWSAFWLQSPIIGCCPEPEIAGIENDIMECFQPGRIACHCNHYNGYADDHREVIGGVGLNVAPAEFHRFGMLWTPGGYTFYVDGVEDGHVSSPVSHRPNFVLISTEVQGYRTKLCGPTDEAKAAVGDTFLVDYVRVFDIG